MGSEALHHAQPAAGQTFLCLLRNLKRLILVGLYLETCGWIMKNKKTKLMSQNSSFMRVERTIDWSDITKKFH